MAQMITVTARHPFVYLTRALAVGDRFQCSPVWAAILRDQGKIALASDRQPVVASPDVDVPAVRARRVRRVVDSTVTPDPVPTA